MSIENIKIESTVTDEEKNLKEKIVYLKEDLIQKEPETIATAHAELSSDSAKNPVADEELFKWGRGQVEKKKNELQDLSKEEQKIQQKKKIKELRNLITSYEEAIKAIERGEKYRVVLNKTSFDAKYDSLDKLHEQITQTESELRQVEQELLKNTIIDIKQTDEINVENSIDTDQQIDQTISGVIEQSDSSDEEFKKVLIEIENAQTQLERAIQKQKEMKKKQRIFSKLKNIFKGRDTLSEVEVAQRVLDDARNRYEQILKNKK